MDVHNSRLLLPVAPGNRTDARLSPCNISPPRRHSKSPEQLLLEQDEVGEPRVVLAAGNTFHEAPAELPMRVKDAARFLGVSPQTVYSWVERKQIPHLRVMGRNIRFLKSELGPFRATFSHEVGYGKT